MESWKTISNSEATKNKLRKGKSNKISLENFLELVENDSFKAKNYI